MNVDSKLKKKKERKEKGTKVQGQLFIHGKGWSVPAGVVCACGCGLLPRKGMCDSGAGVGAGAEGLVRARRARARVRVSAT